ncbi:hypothetical protein D9M73_265100 [compost metagenome]
MLHVLAVAFVDRCRQCLVAVFQQQGGNAGHRRQVVALVLALNVGRQRATHDQPGDHLGAFHAAERGVLGQCHLGKALRVVHQQVKELRVPLRVVEAATLAVHLV